MKKKRVLVLYQKDNPAHVNTVHCFCEDVLTQKCSCDVITLSDHDQTAVPFDAWIEDMFSKADKILVIFSKGARAMWPKVMLAPSTDGPISKFVRALNLCLSDFAENRFGKYLVSYFDHSCYSDVIPTMRSCAVYKLMRDIEQLVFKIHGVNSCGPGFNYEIPSLKFDEHDARLSMAIEQSRSFAKIERRRQESIQFDEAFREVSDQSWRVDESMTEFFDHSGQRDSV